MKTRILIPPIKCQGIKTKIVPLILANVMPVTGRWLEPFMGSGVVGFNSGCNRISFNDLNPHIISFYNALNNSSITPTTVREYLECEGNKLRQKGESHFYEIRRRFNEKRLPLDFLFLSRAGFNGMIRFNSKGEYNVPFCRKTNRFAKAYITKIVNQATWVYKLMQRNQWTFQNRDFSEVFEEATSDDFIYCDPPYYGRHVDYYNTWSAEDETKLYECIKATSAKVILSTWHNNKYRKNPNIEKLWSSFNIITQEHFYHVGAKESNRNAMTEALVLNFQPLVTKTEKDLKIQLKLCYNIF